MDAEATPRANVCSAKAITGVILAGGAGARMGGQDKGLMSLHDRPLASWAIERLAPQVSELLIIANRNLEAYRELGQPVVQDLRAGHLGPLAGIEAALAAARRSWIITCPVDAPLLPADYVQRMSIAAAGRAAVASVGGHPQPVYALLPRNSLPSLRAFLTAGGRKTLLWLQSLGAVTVDLSEHAHGFADADTPQDLRDLHERAAPAANEEFEE
ncbi:MAG: molybdenum cofactor guanylyltransferase MobA [Moraxellaceae bacterium]|nr:molybdenum cofactor guanylyltransferase MobA [Moraxellaceae bacterium]